ncbi:MAG: hypothetical protein ABI968_02280 [Acidobacteriota bacterium]
MSYRFLIAVNGDIRIDVDQQSPAQTWSGSVLLISGRAMATRGLKLEPGSEIDVADGAGLSWQLASQLLERGAPGDPRKRKQAVAIDVLETKDPISVSTPSAGGSYPAPWTAKGWARPLAGGRLAFDFTFGFPNPESPSKHYEVGYSGTWEQAQPHPVIEDTMSLHDWVIHSIGPIHRSDAGGQILDYGASPTPDRYATVGDLRRVLAKSEKK